MLYINGRPVLSDPGLIVEESEAASFVGTPGYVPPEKFIDAASDVYSLGLTLKAASFGSQIEELDKGPAMEADAGAKSFLSWWRILNKATDPAPSRRYQSAKALLKDLTVLRVRMVLPSMGIIVSAVVAIGLAVVIYCALTYVEQLKQEARQDVEAARQNLDNIVKDFKEDH